MGKIPTSYLLCNETIQYVADTLGDDFSPSHLGGKAYHVARMMADGFPVPPAVVIPVSTMPAVDAPTDRLEELADWLDKMVPAWISMLEDQIGNPVLVSVRSGAPVSMPGMMDTVLNVGMTDDILPHWCQIIGVRAAVDSFRRLVQMYGTTVDGIDGGLFETILADAKAHAGVATDAELPVEHLCEVLDTFRDIYAEQVSIQFPADPVVQIRECVQAVWRSWYGDRARRYRDHHGIPHDMGTAVMIQAMVFGNSGEQSGSGVAFTRNPSTGEDEVTGEYLPNAQGEDVVAGTRTPVSLDELPEDLKQELGVISTNLEHTYRDMMDLEFTVDRGKLWMLQCRVGKRTAKAAMKIAADMLADGVIDHAEAARRVTFDQWLVAQRPMVSTHKTPDAEGLPASPGVAVGVVATTSQQAVDLTISGHEVILVRPETTPDDIEGMLVSKGILTSRGGVTSHAAVVARSLDIPAVVGADQVRVEGDMVAIGNVVVSAAEPITIDGDTGRVWHTEQPVTDGGGSGEKDILDTLLSAMYVGGHQPLIRCATAEQVSKCPGTPWVVAFADRDFNDVVALSKAIEYRVKMDHPVVVDFRPRMTANELKMAQLTGLPRIAAAAHLSTILETENNDSRYIKNVSVVLSGLKAIDTRLDDYKNADVVGDPAETIRDILAGRPATPQFIATVIGSEETWAKVQAGLKKVGLPYGEPDAAEPVGRSELARSLLGPSPKATLQGTTGG